MRGSTGQNTIPSSEAVRLPDNAIYITNTFGGLSNTDGLFLDNETRTQSNGVRI